MEEIMNSIMAAPEALVVGAAVGFIAAKMMNRNKGMGGGF